MSELREILKLLKDMNKRIKKLEGVLTSSSKPVSIKPSPKKATKKSVSGLIVELIDDGFFDTPKAFGEIADELKRRGYYYPRTSLTLPLQKLLQKRTLGRISVSGKWAYVKR